MLFGVVLNPSEVTRFFSSFTQSAYRGIMEIVYTTVVGSQMHGLTTPDSDRDVRYITKASLREVISPFVDVSVKVNRGGTEDVESWELRHFTKQLSSGNPTCYEVIKSPLYDKSKYADQIRGIMKHCFDGKRILDAHIGYANSQIERYLKPLDKSFREACFSEELAWYHDHNAKEVWEENKIRRIPKCIVAAYRVIAQATQLLTTGDFQPVVKNYSVELHNKLMRVKTMNPNDITWKFSLNHQAEIESEIKELKALFESLPDSVKFSECDVPAIEDVLMEIYSD